MKNIIAFISGAFFSMGLSISGMTNPKVVKGFLDIFGNWNPSLIGVMVSAICINALVFLFLRRRKPLLEENFCFPNKKTIDSKLLIGASLFGVGWGIAGLCPGPALASLATLHLNILLFVIFMMVGMYTASKLSPRS